MEQGGTWHLRTVSYKGIGGLYPLSSTATALVTEVGLAELEVCGVSSLLILRHQPRPADGPGGVHVAVTPASQQPLGKGKPVAQNPLSHKALEELVMDSTKMWTHGQQVCPASLSDTPGGFPRTLSGCSAPSPHRHSFSLPPKHTSYPKSRHSPLPQVTAPLLIPISPPSPIFPK